MPSPVRSVVGSRSCNSLISVLVSQTAAFYPPSATCLFSSTGINLKSQNNLMLSLMIVLMMTFPLAFLLSSLVS